MNVVICCVNSKYIHSSLAAWCLLSQIKHDCGDELHACVVEGTINEKEENVVERLQKHNPDIIGFCCYIWNISYVKRLAETIKKANKNIQIIFGGPEVSYCAADFLKSYNFVDYIISGEGEYPLVSLINSLACKDKIKNNIGICYRRGDDIIVSEPYIHNGETLSPYCDEYFESLAGRIS